MKKRQEIGKIREYIGEAVTVAGFVDVRRSHGKLIFIDLRDETGKVQMVALAAKKDVCAAAGEIRPEWVIAVDGVVKKRPENLANKNEPNGDVEIEIERIDVMSRAETPLIDVRSDGSDIGEEARLAHRYLDLRRPRMQRNIRLRHRVIRHIRDWLDSEGFVEIETPLLTKSTPEGARDFIVPSRREPGKFYALPQSPQQYKQLLMVAGFERYYQIARCFRDEDTRGDRQPEFTQLDLEMAYVEREDVMVLNERLLIEIARQLLPEKKIQDVPFPRFSYKEAMEKYGTDRPDVRKGKNEPNLLAFCWVVDFPFFEKTDEGGWTFTHNPFSSPKPEHLKWLLSQERIPEILTTQYDVVLNGAEIGGGASAQVSRTSLRRSFARWDTLETKFFRTSAICWRPTALARRPTEASHGDSNGSLLPLPGKRASARCSPSRRPEKAGTL